MTKEYIGDGVYVAWDKHMPDQVWLTTERTEIIDAMRGEVRRVEHRIALGAVEINNLVDFYKRGRDGTS